MWNLPGPFIASCNSQACVFRCHTRFGARDPGHRSYLGALAVSSNEAVSRQIQLDELFEANNWFNFFPLVPEWSAVRFWLPEICVCEMTMTVLCKWFHALDCPSAIQRRHYFSLFAVSAEWQSLQVTGRWGWALNEQLPGWSFSSATHKPWCRQVSVLSSCSCVFASRGWELFLVHGAVLCLSLHRALWAGFGSISSVINTWHMVQGGGVHWQWAGDGLVWVGHRTQHYPCSLFVCPGSRWCLLCSSCSFSAKGCTWESGIICDSCSSK